jgi:hypothetical protein
MDAITSAVCAVNLLHCIEKVQKIRLLYTTLHHYARDEGSIPFTRSNVFKGFVRLAGFCNSFATARRLLPADFLQGRRPFLVVLFPARSRGFGNYFLNKITRVRCGATQSQYN